MPAGQASLEREWRTELQRHHGVTFDALFCLTNMPVGRTLDWLESSGNLTTYAARLVAAFNPATLDGLMCRDLISVSWDGQLYDCDFNQMLELPLVADAAAAGAARIDAVDLEALGARAIATAEHCYGCTAGAGSSCGGALT